METLPAATWTALNLILEPLARTLSVEAAESIIALKTPATLESRLQVLVDRANEGRLNEQEQAEYRGYVMAIEVLCHLKVKARHVTSNSKPG